MSKEIRHPLVEWFDSVEHELMQILAEGCGRYPFWKTTIKGKLNNLHRDKETYTLELVLDRFKTTPQVPQEPGSIPIYNDGGLSHLDTGPQEYLNTPDDYNAQTSYLSAGKMFYNPATMQAGPWSMVDTRCQSNSAWQPG